MSNRQTDIRLAKLYAKLPRLECKGSCSVSCGPIDCSNRERTRIERAAGHELTATDFRCSMLTADGRCSVYELRPMVCRLWGVVENMRCPYGCRPDPRYLTAEEASALNWQALKIGGFPGVARLEAQRQAHGLDRIGGLPTARR